MENNSILIYQSADGKIAVDTVLQDETVWLTQEQMAEILHTNKSNISRLESVSSNISPKLSTLTDYAAAVGYKLKIEFVPDNEVRI